MEMPLLIMVWSDTNISKILYKFCQMVFQKDILFVSKESIAI